MEPVDPEEQLPTDPESSVPQQPQPDHTETTVLTSPPRDVEGVSSEAEDFGNEAENEINHQRDVEGDDSDEVNAKR